MKSPEISAGQIERAGLNEPPLIGPATDAAVKMKSPIANGANTPFHGARVSVATVLTTRMNRNVMISSSVSALPLVMPRPGSVRTALRMRVVEDDPERERGEHAADDLGDPVGDDLAGWEAAARCRPAVTAGL